MQKSLLPVRRMSALPLYRLPSLRSLLLPDHWSDSADGYRNIRNPPDRIIYPLPRLSHNGRLWTERLESVSALHFPDDILPVHTSYLICNHSFFPSPFPNLLPFITEENVFINTFYIRIQFYVNKKMQLALLLHRQTVLFQTYSLRLFIVRIGTR